MKMDDYKISCVMTTYRRFTCVERSISMFLDQDYEGQMEMIVFNTDEEYPLTIGESLKYKNINVINNNIDYKTKQKYDNVGSIRRDAVEHATGTHYICWDDDDIFLPWNIKQCMNGLRKYPDMWAWKPEYSSFWRSDGILEIAGNVMEASIISKLDKIKEHGFKDHKGGGEHWQWLQKFMDDKKIKVDSDSIPGYCFNWSDQGIIRGHKQSGTMAHPNNFNIHKENTKDFATRNLETYDRVKLNEIYQKFVELLRSQIGIINNNQYVITQENYDKYVKQYEGKFI
jgi:hypothetical protein